MSSAEGSSEKTRLKAARLKVKIAFRGCLIWAAVERHTLKSALRGDTKAHKSAYITHLKEKYATYLLFFIIK